jgi:multidrug efflux pump subunit AcrB
MAAASTLAVVENVKQVLPRIKQIVPAACNIEILVDQSVFVRDCVADVVNSRSDAPPLALTALMMLALTGQLAQYSHCRHQYSPGHDGLELLASTSTGQTINSMTLGGLALAVGMLVDDATVEVENVHRNMAMGKDIVTAILDGAQQVATPAMVSTLSICIVFVPVVSS